MVALIVYDVDLVISEVIQEIILHFTTLIKHIRDKEDLYLLDYVTLT